MSQTRDTIRLTRKALLVLIFIVFVALLFVTYKEKQFNSLDFAIANPANAYKTQNFLVNAKPEPQIVFAGDSRAERQLNPKVMRTLTGLQTVNIACSGCDIVRMYDFLSATNVLDKKRFYIFSTSSFQANDGLLDSGYLSLSILRRMSLWSRLRLFGSDFYLRTSEAVAMALTKDEFLSNIRASTLAPAVKEELGFYGTNSDATPTCKGMKIDHYSSSHPWYKNWNAQGSRWQILKETIAKYAERDDYFVFFNPPTSRVWLDCTKDTFIEKAEREFSAMMASEVQKYPNMQFIDLYDDPRFDSDDFYTDIQHMNIHGAKALTTFFAGEIRRRGFLHERKKEE